MGTRSIIMVTGLCKHKQNETYRLYKHYDGYPTGNLDIIRDAIKKGIELRDEYNTRFPEDSARFKTHLTPQGLTGLIIGAASSPDGMSTILEERWHQEPLNENMLGDQGDLEWIYIVNTDTQSVGIYGGEYTGNGPEVAYQKGFVNPLIYIESLRDDCQNDERVETLELVKSIKDLGYSVNGEASNVTTINVVSLAPKPQQTADEKIEAWLEKTKVAVEANSAKQWPDCKLNWNTIEWKKAKKFYQVFTISNMGDGQGSIWLFIDFEGQIFKPSGRNARAKGVRGDIASLKPETLDGSSSFLYRYR